MYKQERKEYAFVAARLVFLFTKVNYFLSILVSLREKNFIALTPGKEDPQSYLPFRV